MNFHVWEAEAEEALSLLQFKLFFAQDSLAGHHHHSCTF
jgi:hypothetical protein